VSTKAAQVMEELQAVLTKHRAALFFGPDNEAELWIEGECAAHITHGDDCRLTYGSRCEGAGACAVGADGNGGDGD
jgi:hypothetical protein